MKLLESNETLLKGNTEIKDDIVQFDDVSIRIIQLVNRHLKLVAKDQSGWDSLFLDPLDGRFWELLYLHSDMHGGGPPLLKLLNSLEAKQKYEV